MIKTFHLRVHLGRHAKRLSEISIAMVAVFPEARVSHDPQRMELSVYASAELEQQIRTWFAVMLDI